VALLELLAVAAWARVVAANVLQGIARRFLRGMVAVRAMHMAVVMIMRVMVMIVIAVGAMNVGLLGHRGLLRNEIGGNYLTLAQQVQVVGKE